MSSGGRTPRRVARLLVLTASNRLIHGADGPDGWKNTGHGGTGFGGDEFATPIEDVARNLDDIGAQRMTQGRTRYDLLIELCAGTAALSWASAGMRFPVSRMCSKAVYAHAILSSVGLREGDPLPRYLWNEPDPELARTLALLASPGGAQAVAEVIRSWIPCPNGHEADGGAWCLDCATWTNGEPPHLVTKGHLEKHLERKRDGTIRRWASGPSTGKQDARRLWERLRKERPEESPEREGAWCYYNGNGYRGGNGDSGFVDAEAGDRFGGFKRREGSALLDTLAPLPASVVCGRAEDIEPRGVEVVCDWCGGTGGDGDTCGQCVGAGWVTPPDCSRVLAVIDPPYHGECDEDGEPVNGSTTGYAHLFHRRDVRKVAAKWHAAGAHVVICECADLSGEMERETGAKWFAADIADARIGQRRTFSKQQREVLTSNRPLVPRHAWPSRGSDPRQGGLFAQG
jgi:hypothetical protein